MIVEVVKAPNGVMLMTSTGVEILVTDNYHASITLPFTFSGRICGLCGNMDRVQGNEPDSTGAPTENSITLANSWSSDP